MGGSAVKAFTFGVPLLAILMLIGCGHAQIERSNMHWHSTRFDGTRQVAANTYMLPMRKLPFPVRLPRGMHPPAAVYAAPKDAQGANRVVIARYAENSDVGIVWLTFTPHAHSLNLKSIASCDGCNDGGGVISLGHGVRGAALSNSAQTSVTWHQNGYEITLLGPAPLTAGTAERMARSTTTAMAGCPGCRPD